MRTAHSRGFTLIELLTVITIIAILAAFSSVGVSRALERAHIADVTSDFKAIEKQLATYATEYGTFPGAKGFRMRGPDEDAMGHEVGTSYMVTLGITNETALYDYYSREGLPYIYIPVNLAQVAKVRKLLETQNTDAARFYAKGVAFVSLNLPLPTVLDAYVLIGAGPGAENSVLVGTTDKNWDRYVCEVTGAPISGLRPAAWDLGNLVKGPDDSSINDAALRAYVLATRDANANGELDFDFIARTRRNESKQDLYKDVPGIKTVPNILYHLPDEVNSSGATQLGSTYGPMIFAPTK